MMLIPGLTYRRLDYWTRRGFLLCEEPTPGSGSHRTWKEGEEVIADRMLRLMKSGFTLEFAATIARLGPGTIDLGPGVAVILGADPTTEESTPGT